MNQESINKRLKIIADLQVELKKLRALYQESLENDPQYQEIQEQAQKHREETKVRKDQVLSNSSYQNIADKIKDVQTELKEHKEILSQDLVDFYKESGSPEIEDEEGNVKRMKFSVKLVNG